MRSLLPTLPLVLALFCPSPVQAVFISVQDLVASSSASFTYQGTNYTAGGPPVTGTAFASSQALAGNSNTPEARNAARVGIDAMAANSRLDGKNFFAFTNIQDNSSIGTYSATIEKLNGAAERLILHFLLPPSFVETTNNAELQHLAVNPAIFASIDSQRCTSFTSCGASTTHFEFQAYLDSTYQSYSHFSQATGQPGMDLSPLLNPVLTFTDGGFLRTVNMEFPAYEGTLDLGVMSAGQVMRFTYRMEARATGFAAFSVGLASINDPFTFDADPVTAGVPISFEGRAVITAPAPGTGALLAVGLGFLVLLHRRAHRRCESVFEHRKR